MRVTSERSTLLLFDLMNTTSRTGAQNRYAALYLDPGYHELKVEYYENMFGTEIALVWDPR